MKLSPKLGSSLMLITNSSGVNTEHPVKINDDETNASRGTNAVMNIFFIFIFLANVTCDLRGAYALGMKIVRFTA